MWLQFIHKYWWLRSPDMNYVDYVCHVRSDGDVDDFGYVYYGSYGSISPDAFMYYNYTSFYVMEDGSMTTYAVEYSYGDALRTSVMYNLYG